MPVDTSHIQRAKGAELHDYFTMITISDYGYRSTVSSKLNSSEIEITFDVDNFDDFYTLLERKNLTGMTREVSGSLRVTGNAYLIIKNLFEEHGIFSFARINFYLRDEVNRNQFNIKETLLMDFSSLRIGPSSLDFTLNEDNIHSYTQSNGSTKYDIEVGDVKKTDSPSTWRNRRLILQESVTFIFKSESSINIPDTPLLRNTYFQPVIFLSGSEIYSKTEHIFMNQKSGNAYNKEPDSFEAYFFEAGKNDEIKIDLNIEIEVINVHSIHLRLMDMDDGIKNVYSREYITNSITQTVKFEYTGTYQIAEGHKFAVAIHCYVISGEATISISPNQTIKMLMRNKGDTVYIDIIRPERLLNELLELMSGRNDIKGSIVWGGNEVEYDYELFLCAAESIRGFNKACIHTSFNDFAQWMNSLGYLGEYPDDKTIIYRQIGESFDASKTALSLTQKECSALTTEVDSDFIYTNVEIGYNIPEYENLNGRFEANGKYDYSTGYISNAEKKLDLVSPYRADSLGIEFLCLERPENGKSTTDNKSDNDVFVVALKVFRGVLGLTRYYDYWNDITINVEGMQIYNAPLNPYYLIQNNLKRLGITTKNLTFTGTSANRSVVLSNGEELREGITLKDRLFDPLVYQFEAVLSGFEFTYENRNGLIEFNYMGITYRGFLSKVQRRFKNKTVAEIRLFAVK